jgi:hypothetical protein
MRMKRVDAKPQSNKTKTRLNHRGTETQIRKDHRNRVIRTTTSE